MHAAAVRSRLRGEAEQRPDGLPGAVVDRPDAVGDRLDDDEAATALARVVGRATLEPAT